MKSRTIMSAVTGACVGLLAIAGLGCAANEKEGHEEAVALDEAPAAVRDAVVKAAGDNKVEKISKESEGGKTAYEAEYHAKGVAHSVKVSEAGAVIEEEEQVNVTDLPAAVTKAVEAKHPGAKVSEAELVKADGKTFYEVEVQVGKAERELKVTADGQVTADEAEEDEQEGKD